MAEIPSVLQVTQLGPETTPGTGVAATDKMASFGISPKPVPKTNPLNVQGYRFPVGLQVGKEHTEATYEGHLSYNEVIWPLHGCLKTPSAPTQGGAGDTDSYTWTFTPSLNAVDTPKTFTVEVGDSNRAREFSYGLFTSFKLSMSASDSEVAMSGDMIGQATTIGSTLTGALSAPAQAAAGPLDSTVGFASTFAGAKTDLTRVLSVDFEITGRWAPVFVLNDQSSYVGHVDTATEAKATISVEADANGEALLTDLRAGTRKYFVWSIDGPLVPSCATATYQVEIRMACEISEPSEWSDQDGIYKLDFTLNGVADAGVSKALEIKVVNALGSI